MVWALGLGFSAVCGFCGFSLLFFLLAHVWFPLYTSCIRRGALRFFNIFLCLPIKKIFKRYNSTYVELLLSNSFFSSRGGRNKKGKKCISAC
jgi:hypothetical protein